MTFVYPLPSDATYDYVPIGPLSIQVGTDLLALALSSGTVSAATDAQDGTWLYMLTNTSPTGATVYSVAYYIPPEAGVWFNSTALWKRAPKPADGAVITASDGSKWIYPAGEDGKLICYMAGSTFSVGERKSRGAILTDPDDLWPLEDPQWDWLPVTAGASVAVGDVVTFSYSVVGVVTNIVTDDNQPYYTRHTPRHTWMDGELETWDALGWWDEPGPELSRRLQGFIWTWFERLPKPTAEAKFLADDGSRWIYVGNSLYYCWGRGTTYAPGALFNRGAIAGALKRRR